MELGDGICRSESLMLIVCLFYSEEPKQIKSKKIIRRGSNKEIQIELSFNNEITQT